MEKRKEFKKLLNEVVLEIFEGMRIREMLLMDVKRELKGSRRIKELVESYDRVMNGKSRWMFFEFDDRFERSMGGLDDFEIKRVMEFGRMRRFLVKK